MIAETRTDIFVVNYSVPCSTYWIGGSTNIDVNVIAPDPLQHLLSYSQYIPNDSGIRKQ